LPGPRRSIACCTWVAVRAGFSPSTRPPSRSVRPARTGRHTGEVCWSSSSSARRKANSTHYGGQLNAAITICGIGLPLNAEQRTRRPIYTVRDKHPDLTVITPQTAQDGQFRAHAASLTLGLQRGPPHEPAWLCKGSSIGITHALTWRKIVYAHPVERSKKRDQPIHELAEWYRRTAGPPGRMHTFLMNPVLSTLNTPVDWSRDAQGRERRVSAQW
jgi:hypothetical protein